MESPLEEVDIGASNSSLDRLAIFTSFLLCVLSWERKDELRVLAGSRGNSFICFKGNTGADRVRVVRMA